ncbi:MAG TPA: dihydroorotate dehydrogenase electron transfer subunit [Bacteroidetes bacterium]|nr:dihydroorotate dehydrogenase electron transfer subunit [Bacteroidota bacterium]
MSESVRHIEQALIPVVDRSVIAEGIFVVRLRSQHLTKYASPGQFINVRCGDGCLPLLRRPFSISRVEGDVLELVFNVVGQGTRMLASRKRGDLVDVLGPLGIPFNISGNYEAALLVGGGLGAAPLPFLTDRLLREKKRIHTFLGARSANQLTGRFLVGLHISTDDGSKGFHGTVVDALKKYLSENKPEKMKIFGCGPTRMLKALAEVADSEGIGCELSLEGDMACGMGICQGCPVERTDGKKKYSLVCVEGPTFNSHEIVLR